MNVESIRQARLISVGRERPKGSFYDMKYLVKRKGGEYNLDSALDRSLSVLDEKIT